MTFNTTSGSSSKCMLVNYDLKVQVILGKKVSMITEQNEPEYFTDFIRVANPLHNITKGRMIKILRRDRVYVS